MIFFEKLQNSLEKVFGPLTKILNESKHIQALTRGFMATLPITLGVSIFAILGNLPIQVWSSFIEKINLASHFQDIISATMSLISLYLTFSIGYFYGELNEEKGITSGLLSVASLIVLMPQTIQVADNQTIGALNSSYLGSNGTFVGMVTALTISTLYCKLMKKNLKVKLPQSVPTMVSDSLSPTFVAIIIFTVVFFVRYAVTFTGFDDIFTLFNTYISKPILSIGASPFSPIFAFTFMNLVWFFGIHPAPIFSVYLSVLITAGTANMEAFQSGLTGTELPYFYFAIMGLAVYIGGAGNTIGLAICMLFSKSERYKALNRVAFIPQLFNINEPYMFGVPVVLNPIYLIPIILTTPIAGGFTYLALKMGLFTSFNPSVSVPWVTPSVISAFLQGGISLMILFIINIGIFTAIYFPFFKIADKQALAEEQLTESTPSPG